MMCCGPVFYLYTLVRLDNQGSSDLCLASDVLNKALTNHEFTQSSSFSGRVIKVSEVAIDVMGKNANFTSRS